MVDDKMEVEENECSPFWRMHKDGMFIYITALLISLFEFFDGHWVGGIGWIMVIMWAFLYHQETYYFRELLPIVRRSLKEKGLLNGEEEKDESDQ